MKIYIIGDSISIQYGPHLEGYLKGVMAYSRKEGVDEALLNLDELPPETLSPEGVEDVAASQKVDPLELREGGCHRRDHLRGCS